VFPDELRIKDILARHLAACPDPSVRDGVRAEQLALEVYDRLPSAESMETLAMAYAQSGRFPKAVEWQERLLAGAREQAGESTVSRLEGNLVRYREGKACCVEPI